MPLQSRKIRPRKGAGQNALGLSQEQLDLLSEIFHEYKDYNRGDRDRILPAMDLEADLNRLSGGRYIPDPTYDIKAL